MRVISLGWGVQSFTLAAMAALGEIEPVDCAIFAQTHYETYSTEGFASRWHWWLRDNGVENYLVQNDVYNQIVIKRGGGEIYIPAFTETETGSGMLRRQCTGKWKIAPIRRFLQKNRNGEQVEMLLGISTDEFQRMRQSDVKYITNVYPLIEKRMSRADCVEWLKSHDLEVPTKSACYFCPFHTTKEWGELKNSADWDRVVKVDEMIRNARPGEKGWRLYLHPSLKPISEIDFRTAEEKGQLRLWDQECTGICGV